MGPQEVPTSAALDLLTLLIKDEAFNQLRYTHKAQHRQSIVHRQTHTKHTQRAVYIILTHMSLCLTHHCHPLLASRLSSLCVYVLYVRTKQQLGYVVFCSVSAADRYILALRYRTVTHHCHIS